MIDFNNPNCKEVKRLYARIKRHFKRFSRYFEFEQIRWVSDGLNGKIPDGRNSYVVNGILGNYSATFRRLATDGGISNYSQGQSLYIICMYDKNIPFKIGDTMISGNITYFISEFINIQDLDLYWLITLNFTDTERSDLIDG